MISDFCSAAMPWVMMGIFVAISCACLSAKESRKK